VPDTHAINRSEPAEAERPDPLRPAAVRFALDLAAASDNPAAVDQLFADALGTHGPEVFRHVADQALRHTITAVVQPLVDLAERHSHPVRQRLADAAERAHGDLS
jgi:hypothetical protein